MCNQDEGWQASRYFSERKMAELYDEHAGRPAKTPPLPERATELLLIARKGAKKAIEASLELADELEAA